MPTKIKIMSWNLRCYGTRDKTPDEIRLIANTILDSRADIVCIQELMIGPGVGPLINDPISMLSLQRFARISQELEDLDELTTNWQFAVTGRNKGRSISRYSVSDAYGFLWKRFPNLSNFGHQDPSTHIALHNLGILRLNNGNFPGRRPGLFSLDVEYNEVQRLSHRINLISFHAKTPTNVNYQARIEGAGRAIQRLGEFNEIGGILQVPIPNDNTIVLGDFNFDVSNPKAVNTNPYHIFNYTMRIGNLGPPVQDIKTTYTNNRNSINRRVSSYDNIFDNPNSPNLIFINSTYIDFITNAALLIGGMQHWPTAWDWYYGRQNQGYVDTRGVSDHVPVVAEYQLQ